MARDAKTGRFLKHATAAERNVAFDGPVLSQFGRTGLKRSRGALQEEFHPHLRGRKAIKVYEEMGANSPMVGAALWVYEAAARQVPWSFQPHESEDAEASRLSDWFEGARTDLETPWNQLISEYMTTPQFGWSWFETLFKLRRGPTESESIFHSQHADGLWGWRDFAPRSQDSWDEWEYDEDEALCGMWQRVETEAVRRFVPLRKSLHFTVRSRKRSPEGRSLLRPAYRPYFFLTAAEEAEGIGIERNMNGVPVIRIPWQAMHPGASAAEKSLYTQAKDMVAHLRQDSIAGAVWPGKFDREGKQTGFDIELMAPGKNVSEADPVIRRQRSDIMVAMLVEMLLLGNSTSTGSWSLSSDQSSLAAMAMNAVLDTFVSVIQRTAVPQLARLNGFRMDRLPRLTHGDIEKESVQQLAAAVAPLVQSGALVPDDALRRHIRDSQGWPAEEPLTVQPVAPGAEPDPRPNPTGAPIPGFE